MMAREMLSAGSLAFVPLGISTFLCSSPAGVVSPARPQRQHARPRSASAASPRANLSSTNISNLCSIWDAQNLPRSVIARGPQPNKKPPVPVPTVSFGEGQMDVFSRLAKDRILVLGRQVDDETANQLVAQMLFLSAEDPTKDITLYINSPGGSVSAGLAIFDTMQYIPCDVATICFGTAASMGAFLLCAGKKGKRKSLPNARIMIHQPLGGAQGQAADIEIQAKEIIFIRSLLNGYIANATGQPIEKVRKDSDRDFFMTPEEAVEYGLIDEVVKTRRPLPKPAMPVLK